MILNIVIPDVSKLDFAIKSSYIVCDKKTRTVYPGFTDSFGDLYLIYEDGGCSEVPSECYEIIKQIEKIEVS